MHFVDEKNFSMITELCRFISAEKINIRHLEIILLVNQYSGHPASFFEDKIGHKNKMTLHNVINELIGHSRNPSKKTLLTAGRNVLGRRPGQRGTLAMGLYVTAEGKRLLKRLSKIEVD